MRSHDVEQMEAFLKTRLGVPNDNIIKLTASHGDGMQPSEDAAMWPTFDNITAAFQRLDEMAGEGAHVVLHYSGHGGRVESIYPLDVKSGEIDEAFVPTDIGTDAGRYLRDLQMAHWLNKLSQKERRVVAILDCCHSGGMTRGDDAVTRGAEGVDRANRPNDIPNSDEMASWTALTENGTRSVSGTNLPESDNWVVLAACRPHELAVEFKFDGENKHGALTYWLLKTLQSNGLSLSFRQLHQRLLGRIKSQFA